LKFSPLELNFFDAILGNIFLNAYKVDIFYNGSKVKVHSKVGFKLMNLDANYNYVLAKIGINLVVLVKELNQSLSFVILMTLKVFKRELKLQGAKQPLNYILDSLNKFSKVLTDEFPNFFHLVKRLTIRRKCCLIWPCCPRHPIG
jgi:hypothetical protein